VFVGKSKAFRMVAALVDNCREEVVLTRKRTREASIVCFWPLVVEGGGSRRVQASKVIVCSVPMAHGYWGLALGGANGSAPEGWREPILDV
jgi:hypothetical protein